MWNPSSKLDSSRIGLGWNLFIGPGAVGTDKSTGEILNTIYKRKSAVRELNRS